MPGQAFPRGARFPDPVTFGAVPGLNSLYRVVLPLFEEGRTNDESKLKYDSNLGLRIVGVEKMLDKRYLDEHYGGDESALVGMSIFAHNDFIIGLLDQPGPVSAGGQLADPDDWTRTGGGRGGPLFNNMIEAAGVEGDDVDDICAQMEGREVIVAVRIEKDQSGTYPDKNRLVKFYPVPQEPAKPAPRPAAAAPAPAARPAPAPSAARNVAAAARPAPTPASRPAPAPAARPAAARPAPAATAAQLYPCDICISDGVNEAEAMYPRSEIAKHLREAHPEA